MLKRFYPKQFCDSVYSIDFAKLKKQGCKGLIFDIDNTLATFDVPEPPKKVVELIENLKSEGFQIALFSNNSRARVERFNSSLKLPALAKAGKPKKKGIRKLLSMLELDNKSVVLIGDQMFTDVWGGNRMGIYTILLKPIANRDEWTVKLKRLPEKIVMKSYQKYLSKNKKNN